MDATVCIPGSWIRRRAGAGTWAHSRTARRPKGTSARCNSSSTAGRLAAGDKDASSAALADDHVHRALARDVFGGRIAERAQVHAVPEVLSGAEEHGAQRHVHLVDQARAEKLPDGRYAAADTNVTIAGRFLRLLQCGFDPVGDKIERRPARHLDGFAWVVCQHEGRHVVRRFVSPPALPALVGPGSAHGPEHVAPENPRADSGKTLLGHAVVDSRLAAFQTVHAAPRAGLEEPLEDLGAPQAE